MMFDDPASAISITLATIDMIYCIIWLRYLDFYITVRTVRIVWYSDESD